MPKCPQCGGEMKFDRNLRMYVCKQCGLMLTRMELDMLREKAYEKERDVAEEYLEWWQTRKRR
jgi:tRNA(Ile2) C34 agmatinyltransferase TiaS